MSLLSACCLASTYGTGRVSFLLDWSARRSLCAALPWSQGRKLVFFLLTLQKRRRRELFILRRRPCGWRKKSSCIWSEWFSIPSTLLRFISGFSQIQFILSAYAVAI